MSDREGMTQLEALQRAYGRLSKMEQGNDGEVTRYWAEGYDEPGALEVLLEQWDLEALLVIQPGGFAVLQPSGYKGELGTKKDPTWVPCYIIAAAIIWHMRKWGNAAQYICYWTAKGKYIEVHISGNTTMHKSGMLPVYLQPCDL